MYKRFFSRLQRSGLLALLTGLACAIPGEVRAGESVVSSADSGVREVSRAGLMGFVEMLLAAGERPMEIAEIEQAREIRWVMAECPFVRRASSCDCRSVSLPTTSGDPIRVMR